MNLISVIISTYNWKEALALCLASFFAQNDLNFEIIIADDGSYPDTGELVSQLKAQSPVPLKYCCQEDQGFRVGMIRNKAVMQSQGNYLIFIDGDCLVQTDFVARHRQLAQPDCFVPGNRVLLRQLYTDKVIAQKIPLHRATLSNFIWLRVQNKINKFLPFIKMPLGFLRHLFPNKWQNAMTCNLAMWRNDFIKVNGFDELYEGWGYEDSDLVIRLIHSGIKRKDGRFAAPVMHLWHPHYARNHHELNYRRLQERLVEKDFTFAIKGISQYIL